MTKSKKPAKTGLASAAWVSALLLALTLGTAAPAFAQSDAGAAAATEPAPAADPAPAPEPAADPAPAPAAEPEPAAEEPKAEEPAPAAGGTSLQKLSDEVMAILLPILGTLATGLAGLLLAWVRKKFKLDIGDKQLEAWAKLAGRAADRAGEWARNKLKEATDGKTIPGPEILEVGANWAIEVGKAAGLPDIGREKLEGLIEAHLFSRRKDPADPLPMDVEEGSEDSEG